MMGHCHCDRQNCKRNGVLSSFQAVEIFLKSLQPVVSFIQKPTASSVAREYNVSEKTIRDIWTGRTWHRETLPFDPNRKPRVSKPVGRPLGCRDSAQRRRRVMTNCDAVHPTGGTENGPGTWETSSMENISNSPPPGFICPCYNRISKRPKDDDCNFSSNLQLPPCIRSGSDSLQHLSFGEQHHLASQHLAHRHVEPTRDRFEAAPLPGEYLWNLGASAFAASLAPTSAPAPASTTACSHELYLGSQAAASHVLGPRGYSQAAAAGTCFHSCRPTPSFCPDCFDSDPVLAAEVPGLAWSSRADSRPQCPAAWDADTDPARCSRRRGRGVSLTYREGLVRTSRAGSARSGRARGPWVTDCRALRAGRMGLH